MTATTPEQFARELDCEWHAKGAGVCDDVGAPFRGIPRELCELEYLNERELLCLMLRRHGKTLREIGALVGRSPERVRQILMKSARIGERFSPRTKLVRKMLRLAPKAAAPGTTYVHGPCPKLLEHGHLSRATSTVQFHCEHCGAQATPLAGSVGG